MQISNSLSKRIKSAFFMLGIVGFALYQGGYFLMVGLFALGIGLLYEFMSLYRKIWHGNLIKLIGFALLVTTYSAVALFALWQIRQGEDGLTHAIMIILMVIATDLGGYGFGKNIGGPKLAPIISPNKTWSGLLGAMFLSGIVGLLFMETVAVGLMLGAGIAIIAQIGDLLESWLKRKAGVKDSSNLIPGHGGILDRFDGYLTALPCYYAFLYLF